MKGACKLFLGLATLMVVAALTAGFVIIPSPALQHLYDIDGKRSDGLDTLSSAINVYVVAHGALPPSLAGLVDDVTWAADASRDPETGAPYEYVPGQGLAYRLCAVYAAASQSGAMGYYVHPAGRACEERLAKRPAATPAPASGGKGDRP